VTTPIQTTGQLEIKQILVMEGKTTKKHLVALCENNQIWVRLWSGTRWEWIELEDQDEV